METNLWYKVTKCPPKSILAVGNHIKLTDDDMLHCLDAGGWVKAEHVEEILRDVEYEVGIELIRQREALLQEAITSIRKKLQN